ncbi:MAG: hypothetical protein ACO1SX_25765 [Actinomycetota bacterium]
MPDPHSTADEMLAYWQRLAGEDPARPWAEENLGMFFQTFRPDGQGVDAAFQGVAGAEEILPRLRRVYSATAEGWENEDGQDFYFMVRRPPPLSRARAAELAAAHLRKVAAMAAELHAAEGDDTAMELVQLLTPLPEVEVFSGATPWPPDDDDPETLVYEVTTDYMRYLKWVLSPVASHAHLLKEAFYTIACDAGVAYHLQWPLYRHLTPISEPFAEYFELWKHGAGYRFESETQIRVYVPNLLP